MNRGLLISTMPDKRTRLTKQTVRRLLGGVFYLLAVTLLALGYVYVSAGAVNLDNFTPQRWQELFYFTSGVQLLLIGCVTPGMAVYAVSSARRIQSSNTPMLCLRGPMGHMLGQLFLATRFMLLLTGTAIPISAVCVLLGGLAFTRLLAVLGFYLFVIAVLGMIGVYFSVLLRKTAFTAAAAYGTAAAMYVLTGLLAIFLQGTAIGNGAAGYVLALNPMSALVSILNANFTSEIVNGMIQIQLWHIFIAVYTMLSAILLWLSSRLTVERNKYY